MITLISKQLFELTNFEICSYFTTVSFLRIKYKLSHVWCIIWYCITNLTTFGGVTSKKPPGGSLKLYFLLVWKHLKYESPGTTSQMQMELTGYMYHLNTFQFFKNWCQLMSGWEANLRSHQKCQKLTKYSTSTSPKNSSQNAINVGTFSPTSITT